MKINNRLLGKSKVNQSFEKGHIYRMVNHPQDTYICVANKGLGLYGVKGNSLFDINHCKPDVYEDVTNQYVLQYVGD